MRTLAAAALLLPGGCGAGLVTAIASSNNNGGGSHAVLTVQPVAQLPLVPGSNSTTRSVVIANASLSQDGLRVEVRAPGMDPVPQLRPTPLVQGSSTVVTFQLVMDAFRTHFGTGADVQATLAVLVGDHEVATPASVTLVAQPSAELVDGSEQPQPLLRLLLSPNGGTRAYLRVHGLQSTATGLQMTVTTRDPSGQLDPDGVPLQLTRVCTTLTTTPPQVDPVGTIVAADVPGNTFVCEAKLAVEDPISGRTNDVATNGVANVFYQPEVTVASPAQGPAEGGTVVTLSGRALTPLDFSVTPPRPDFDHIAIQFQKGHRVIDLESTAIRRAESTVDRLKFVVPPSPDARPGQCQIVLTVPGNVTAETDLFRYANPAPVFGPRGAVLEGQPIAVQPIELEGAPTSSGTQVAPDFGVLYDDGGVPQLQLFAAQENGMFIRFGAPMQVGNPEVPSEKHPRDLATGDLDNDGVPDFLIANAGFGTATHQIVLGRSAPNPPLGPIRLLPGAADVARCRVADFDGDGRLDLLLVPGPGSGQPHVWRSTSFAGSPQFVDLGPLPVRTFAYDAVEIADIDGDGHLDIALLGGGAQPRIDVAYGDGAGGFAVGTQMDLAIPSYTPDASSRGVGVHLVHGADHRPIALAVVLAGLPQPTQTPPIVVVVPESQPRTFVQPAPPQPPNIAGNLLAAPLDPLGTSLVADMDDDGVEEMVVAAADTSLTPLFLLRLVQGPTDADTHFTLLTVQPGAQEIRRVSALHFGIASPPDPARNRPAVHAVFVAHESVADGVVEPRLSTLLVFHTAAPPPNNQLTLTSADGDGPLPGPARSLVEGNFLPTSVAADRGLSAAHDLAVGTPGSPALATGVVLVANDGFGGITLSLSMRDDHIVPETLTRIPAPPGQIESLAYLTDDGHLSIWRPDESLPVPQSPTFVSAADLRQFASSPELQTAAVDPTSIVRCADVDGDGVNDLVVLIHFTAPEPLGDGDAMLLVLRGRSSPGAGELPFELPTVATPVHGHASDFALGDFAPGPSPTQLELALAVPTGSAPGGTDGDHVLFYRLDPAQSTPVYRRSASTTGPQLLFAGDLPTRLAAADFDGNGTIDLLVATANGSLRMFLNSGVPANPPDEVAIEAFVQSFSSPIASPPGRPRFLSLGDINGDGILDVLLTTESTLTAAGTLSTSVAFYLSSGSGSLTGPTFVSPTLLGDRDARVGIDLGDCNGDGVPDIAAGWNTVGSPGHLDLNIRVLFGGSRKELRE